jgi:1,4-dihydroxy-2-naphthoyl-CoA synthase
MSNSMKRLDNVCESKYYIYKNGNPIASLLKKSYAILLQKEGVDIMKKYETVITEEKNHVGILTFNRPEKMNVFNLKLGEDTFDAFIEMEENKEIRVVIIKGAGKHFSAGIDVKEIFEGSQTEREYLLDKT